MSEEAITSELRVGAVPSVFEACGLGNRRFQQLGTLYHHHVVSRLSTGPLAGEYDDSARRDSLGGGPNQVVLGMVSVAG
jgi:hypothetical protein